MGKIRAFFDEWSARRQGRRGMSRDFQKSARHIIGPTGFNFSSAWHRLEKEDGSYLRSFEPRVPPSTFVSSRDLTRANMPIPLVERCIEDWNKSEAESAQPTDAGD